ncbi:M20/M25/M40 family metallo-hydrolase [Terrilactibacillus sp. BCM23-1]|uniref:M20/M25/M40 family metallo-hydrolase n=1 Tax=Terrilactibacillus tamarindi TaxID=2599694 RepID=A0A6N8CPM9_9BACI|nr:M20/M25/M40 family metallo-hydrolase [Terrilactibacillus tamarindi]MTT32124.1 M20/M25/M40 family metallo-hydrolase [Terrilactibacillus tamarindi]
MYEHIKDLSFSNKIEFLTRSLVNISSINGTSGEVDLAKTIEKILRSFPYFKENPSKVWTQQLQDDPLGRQNVFALLRSKSKNDKTVIYHAHMDTVGIDDFGSLKTSAFQSNELEQYFKVYDQDPEVKQDASTGEWLFGRGALDMKSGIAVHLVNLLSYSERREELNGNILVMFNPVEENQHTGVIEATKELHRLRIEEKLHYAMAINSDFNSPLYPNDPNRYIYTGNAGKLLGCFYIKGREAHVGQTLTGVDPTLIASRINDHLNNNMDFAESIPNETVLPPSCLFQRDQKEFYNVQTAGKSHLYFNYFLYEASPSEVLEKLIHVAKQSCEEVKLYLGSQYKRFLANSALIDDQTDWNIKVYGYDHYINHIKSQGIDVNSVVKATVSQYPDADIRDVCFHIVDALEQLDHDKQPKVIVFFGPPYCPHNYLEDHVDDQRQCRLILEHAIDKIANETNESFAIKKFFPYLSDSSYLSMNGTEDDAEDLKMNIPVWDHLYQLPLDLIHHLNIPSINIGVYGKDAHQWTERVYKPYSFHVLPMLIQEITNTTLKGINSLSYNTKK